MLPPDELLPARFHWAVIHIKNGDDKDGTIPSQ